MIFLEVIFFLSYMMLVLFSTIHPSNSEQVNLFLIIGIAGCIINIILAIYILTRFGMPPAAPKSDFSLKKKIAFLVFKRQRWDIVLFLTIPFVPFVDILLYKWWYVMGSCLAETALWLFRIMNFERYLNEA